MAASKPQSPSSSRRLVDGEIREHFLEIIDIQDRQVVTVIEILSPDNKVSRSQGLESFRKKRMAIMKSRSHWVEIDLLRRGVSLALRKRIRPHEYFVHISPTWLRPNGHVWPIRLSQQLPVDSSPAPGAGADTHSTCKPFSMPLMIAPVMIE